jgi:nitronate monooxygenase
MGLPSTLRDRLTLPAVAAPMFLCSGVELATEVCKAGLVGRKESQALRVGSSATAKLM